MRLVLQVTLVLLVTPTGLGEPPSVATLIEQLGSTSFAEREAAGKRLEAIGAPALDPIRQAAATAPDPEVKQRAARVGQRIVEALGHEELKQLQGVWKLSRAEYRGAPRAIPGNLFELNFKDDAALLKTDGFREGMRRRCRSY